jgi:hypothetical protein
LGKAMGHQPTVFKRAFEKYELVQIQQHQGEPLIKQLDSIYNQHYLLF